MLYFRDIKYGENIEGLPDVLILAASHKMNDVYHCD